MRTLLLLTCGMLWLSGCIAPQQKVPTVYDFGATVSSLKQPATKPQRTKHAISIQIANVVLPLWLENPAIHYRLAYSNPAKLYTYANSRWVASPAILLTQQIRCLVSNETSYFVVKNSVHARTNYILQVELEEFVQVFDRIDNSHVVVSLRASLIDRRSRMVLSQKRFSSQLAAQTADAAGAVSAFSTVSQQLIHQVVNWIHLEASSRIINSSVSRLAPLVIRIDG